MRSLLNQITALSLRLRWVTIAITAAIIVGGYLSFTSLNQELLPDIEFPQTFVVIQNGGATSDQILTMYSIPIEERTQEINQVVNVETTSNDGFGFAIIRNEFGADQDQIVSDIKASLDDIELPVRRINPPSGMDGSDLIGELSPEAMAWLYQWAQSEESGFVPQLTRETLRSFSPEALSVLPEEAFADLSMEVREEVMPDTLVEAPEFDPANPPALPESWQGDARFSTVEDIVELTTTRNLAGVLNDLVENNHLVGALGKTDDLTVADIELFLQIEERCRALERPEREDGSDPCSFVAELDAATILALSDDVLAALPDNYLDQLDLIERNTIAEVRAAEAITGEDHVREAVLLPDSWRVEAPNIITFSFSDIPLGVITINSDSWTQDELQAFVENELSPRLREADLVASVSIDGGEVIPVSVRNPAREEVGLPLLEEETESTSEEPAETGSTETPTANTYPEGPALAPAWGALAGMVGLDAFDTADDIFAVVGKDIQGIEITSAAGFVNSIAEQPTASFLLDTLTPEILDFLAENEADFYENLNEGIVDQVNGGTEASTTEEPSSDFPEGPALPASWAAVAAFIGADEMDTADDILKIVGQEVMGQEVTSAAVFINGLGATPASAPLLDTLTLEILDFLAENEADFYANLDPAIVANLGSPALGEAWLQLSNQELLIDRPLTNVSELQAAGALETIQKILDITDNEALSGFTIRLMDGLSGDVINALVEENPDFLNELAASHPNALRDFSRDALESEAVTEFLASSEDETLVADLQTILDGEPTAAERELANNGASEVFVDENAPILPSSWLPVAPFVNANELDTADDLFNVPNYAGAADLISSFALGQNGQGLVRDLELEHWLYLSEIESTFWDNLNGSAVRLINQDTVDITQLPQSIQTRIAAGGDAYEPEKTVTRTNSSPSLQVAIYKEDGANTVIGWDNVSEVIATFSDREEIEIKEIFEQATFITTSLDSVVREGTTGAILAIIMILIFMNLSFRSTVVISVSIPGSIMFGFLMIYLVPNNVYQFLAPIVDDVGRDTFLGSILVVVLRLFPETFTLNIMTLSGMTVAIGRVVDDSIVILENIYRNIGLQKVGEETSESKRTAIMNGVSEVNVAILAATLTTMLVFIPLGLFGGVIGAFFLPFGLASAYALVGSYVMSITVVPVLTEMFISRETMPEEGTIKIKNEMTAAQKIWGSISNLFIGGMIWVSDIYGQLIRLALLNIWTRLAVIATAIVSLVFGLALMGQRPVQFLPSFGEPTITVSVNLPAEADGKPITIAQTDAKVSVLENWLAEQKEQNVGISEVQVVVGGAGNNGFAPSQGITETTASVSVVMVDQESLDALVPVLRVEAERIFDDLNNDGVSDYADAGEDEVIRSNATVSGAAADGGFGGFALVLQGADDDNQPTLPQLAAYNEVILEALNGVEGLANVELESSLGGGSGTTYVRIDGVPALRYVAEVESEDVIGTTQIATKDTQAAIDELFASDSSLVKVEITEGFESQQQSEGIVDIFASMAIATLIAYVLLVITFGNFVLPLEILVSLPLAVVGAAIGLTVTNRVLGLPAMVGLLMLIGIVITNAIVFLDRVQQNRREKNLETREALIEAGSVRLRPILMTASTTIIAQVPLALSTESGAIIAAELGTVVIGGLISSTALTLIVLPVVYSLVDSLIKLIWGLLTDGGGKANA